MMLLCYHQSVNLRGIGAHLCGRPLEPKLLFPLLRFHISVPLSTFYILHRIDVIRLGYGERASEMSLCIFSDFTRPAHVVLTPSW